MKRTETIISISTHSLELGVEAVKAIPVAVIAAEERLRRRVLAVVRVVLASSFIWVTALLSMGATVATAFANQLVKKPSARERVVEQKSHKRKSIKKEPSAKMEGVASWYGRQFHNCKTASGKLFDKNSMMAAHRTLPFGTLVRVTNTDNNTSCIVEIADRGPYVGRRVIDVSKAAADELGFTSAGTAHVRLEVINNIFAERVLNSHSVHAATDALRSHSYALGLTTPVQ